MNERTKHLVVTLAFFAGAQTVSGIGALAQAPAKPKAPAADGGGSALPLPAKSGAGESYHGGRGHSDIQMAASLLNADQTKQYQEIMKASQEQSLPLIKQLRELSDKADSDPAAAKQMDDIQHQLAQERKQTRDKVLGLLTPDQKVQFEKLRAERRAEKKLEHQNAGDSDKADAGKASSHSPAAAN